MKLPTLSSAKVEHKKAFQPNLDNETAILAADPPRSLSNFCASFVSVPAGYGYRSKPALPITIKLPCDNRL